MALLIAHRGASNEAPENTISALQYALNLSVDVVECDLRLTLDGHLVALHDAFLGRTAWGAAGKKVNEVTLAEIKSLNAGSWFHPRFSAEKVPTFEEILALNWGTTQLMAEIKYEDDSSLELLAQTVVEKMAGKPFIHVGSFSAPLLKRIRELNPSLSLVGIVERLDCLAEFESLSLTTMALWYKLITPSLIANFQGRNCEVWAFTVDQESKAKFLISIGVQGIITNKPRELLHCVKSSTALN